MLVLRLIPVMFMNACRLHMHMASINKIQAGHSADVAYHGVIYAAVMLSMVILAIAVNSWAWLLVAAIGWGMILFAHAVYVFLFETGGADQAENNRVVKHMVNETRAINPMAS